MRIYGSLLAAAMVAVLAALCWQSAARSFAAAHGRASSSESYWPSGKVRVPLSWPATQASASAHVTKRNSVVYPYSVVPGGVADSEDLQRAAEYDPVVWQHYASFQYEHARLMRATNAREVYLSYRLRNRIYWTRKKVRLLPGELLLTDGVITARTRCGNQVSETPRPEVSKEEPAEDLFDKPVAELEPIAPALPIPSSYLPPSLPGATPLLPQGPQPSTRVYPVPPYIPYPTAHPPYIPYPTVHPKPPIRHLTVPEGGSSLVYALGAWVTCLGAMLVRTRVAKPKES